MGRKKIKSEEKKQNISITLNPEIIKYFQKTHFNLSSLINHLLTEYIENGEKNMYKMKFCKTFRRFPKTKGK